LAKASLSFFLAGLYSFFHAKKKHDTITNAKLRECQRGLIK
jgi:hypothetical protein